MTVPGQTFVRGRGLDSEWEGALQVEGTTAEPRITGALQVRRGAFELLGQRFDLRGGTIEFTGATPPNPVLDIQAVTQAAYITAVVAITGEAMSFEATATVRIVPDVDFDCTDVIGKVYDDANRNGRQDYDEAGIPGVRLATARGLLATTDQYGRFHITCAITPREGRGSNFVLKLDDRTLPSGYRASTDLLQIERATPGKALEFNFGASIHRVVGLDVADPVFEPDAIEVRPIWRPRVDILLDELRKAPAVLRLSYLADLEEPRLVEQRLDALREVILEAWRTHEECCSYELKVETEVFWRRGAPPDEPARIGDRR